VTGGGKTRCFDRTSCGSPADTGPPPVLLSTLMPALRSFLAEVLACIY
jgi:hypothetical protein